MKKDDLRQYVGKEIEVSFKIAPHKFYKGVLVEPPRPLHNNPRLGEFYITDGDLQRYMTPSNVASIKIIPESEGEDEQETKSRRLQSLLKPSIYNKIKELADNNGRSVNSLINLALVKFLADTKTLLDIEPPDAPTGYVNLKGTYIKTSEIAAVGKYIVDTKTATRISLKSRHEISIDAPIEEVIAKIAEAEAEQ